MMIFTLHRNQINILQRKHIHDSENESQESEQVVNVVDTLMKFVIRC